MPGVNVITQARTGPVTPGQAQTGTLFVAGLTERGPSDAAYLVRSMAEYEERFGRRVTYGYVYDTLETFFQEGGNRAYVVRAVGAAATVGNLPLMDRAATPLTTLGVFGRGAGTWSTAVTIQVENGTITNTFRILVRRDGEIVERYDNLTSPSDAVNRINATSRLIEVRDEGSVTPAPNNNPAVRAATALSAGADDRASVTATTMLTALNTHASTDLGAGAVAIPGQDSATVGAGLIAHARDRRRIALLATPRVTTPAAAITAAQALVGSSGSEHAGLFYPWVHIDVGGGVRKAIPPEGYVAGVRARSHETEGPWRAPAGEVAIARFVVDVETDVDRINGDLLDGANVSAIRPIGETIRLYGWRSLSADRDNYTLLTGRDVMNYVADEGHNRLEQFVFRSIDPRGALFGEMAAEITGLVDPIATAGGLYARYDDNNELLDPGYAVDTGPSVNTPASIAQNVAKVAVALRVSPTGALIELIITKVGLNANL